jgi:hypothetical protein
MAGGMPTDQVKALFDQGFSQMAYSVLVSKFPNLAADIVTFKVIESDQDKGSGAGAFVVQQGNRTFYVPVVMVDSQIKPLDIVYDKVSNVFLPLSKDWLAQLEKNSPSDLGNGVKPPKTMATDVDIRSTVVPPTTGRYSYAAERDAGVVFTEAQNQVTEPKLAFLSFLQRAPNRVKKAAALVFQTHPSLLKTAVRTYGRTAFVDALSFTAEKSAMKVDPSPVAASGGLIIADKATDAKTLKDTFGAEAGTAFQGVTLKGYAAKDTRKKLNRALAVQPYRDLMEPKSAGVYRLFKTDGTALTALIVPNPIDFSQGRGRRVPARNIRFRAKNDAPANPDQGFGVHYRVPGLSGYDDAVHIDRYVGVSSDGKLLDGNQFMGMPVPGSELEGSKVYANLLTSDDVAPPRSGQRGIFVQRRGGSFVATVPVKVENVSTLSDDVKQVVVSGAFGTRTLVFDPQSSASKLMAPVSSTVVYLPRDFVFLATDGDVVNGDLLNNPADVSRWALRGLVKQGAELFKVSQPTPESGFVIDGGEYAFVPALRKIALDAGISVDDAAFALEKAAQHGRFEFWAVSEGQYSKLAADGQPMDPAQAAMAQVQAAPVAAAPQGPSPVDMAVAEQMQNLQGQMQALTQMQQLLATVQQRASMIAGGGGAAGSPEAAAAAMGGPMPPEMMGAGMPVQGMQPGMQPGMPQQDAPADQGMASMSAENVDPEQLAGQVNPQFMEQAGELNDAGVFDAAALSSMAQAPQLRDLASVYLPNLEQALDNIGRVLLTLWMSETQIRGDIGTQAFVKLEDNLRSTFKNLGELVLKLSQNTLVLRDTAQNRLE